MFDIRHLRRTSPACPASIAVFNFFQCRTCPAWFIKLQPVWQKKEIILPTLPFNPHHKNKHLIFCQLYNTAVCRMTKLQVNQIFFSQHLRVYFSSNSYRAQSPRETRVAMFVFSCKVCYNQALANMVSTRLTFVIKLQMVSSRVYVFRRKNSVLFFIFLKDCKNILIFPNTYCVSLRMFWISQIEHIVLFKPIRAPF